MNRLSIFCLFVIATWIAFSPAPAWARCDINDAVCNGPCSAALEQFGVSPAHRPSPHHIIAMVADSWPPTPPMSRTVLVDAYWQDNQSGAYGDNNGVCKFVHSQPTTCGGPYPACSGSCATGSSCRTDAQTEQCLCVPIE